MSTSYAIFVNPDANSDIYTLLLAQVDNSNSVTSVDTEISLEALETEINKVPDNDDIVFLLHPNYATSMNADQLSDLQNYLHNIFVTNVIDDVDIFYLTNFMDNCLNRVELDVQPIDNISNVSVTFSTAPNGIGCVATTKTKWQNIIALAQGQDEKNMSAKLSGLVIGEQIIAATSQPLFVFPDLNKQTDVLDTLKTQYCRIEKNFGRAVPNTENMSFFWFVLGVSVIVFVAWVLSYYMPKNKVMLMTKY